ncbi:2-hydroxyacyl-CoA dehydratase family protein [Lawsonibacter asaccharolyticus]|uniref:2-hydroxyacyl-CoA dehydratase subunit D n=1 Tax=Lawsonibacter asaccharolyticus TaxID=2108523 RepID=UPI00265A3479|nr:2-hydroxyacyl-CoA dehydratase family protein [Lawsonibacter asaccharolyticus]UMM47259.1 2-hydroxyacyl-CoA dehydratase family protein [Lawsonibacter asaccharolyticus]
MADWKTSLERLQRACANPREQLDRYLKQGKQVVGCFAPYAPEELVHAAGLIPMGMWGGRTELKLAKSYLPAFACPIMQANMELGLKGAYQGISAVIIPTMCDTLRCMTQNWRFGMKDIPMIPIVYPQNRTSPASVDYLISEFETVLTILYTITGNMVSEKSMEEAIAVYNQHNATMREFDTAANDHLDVITPKVRHVVHKSAFFFEKGEHTALVQEIIAGLKELPAHHWTGNKIILAGILCEPEEVLDILEENQLAVVADDLAQESRQYRTDTPEKGGGALKRLALQWNARYGCSLIHELGKPRGKMLAKMCQETGAQGVISCMMKFCDPEEYDEPYLEADLRKAGIHVMNIDIDPLNHSYEQVRTRVQSFCEML